MILLHILLQTIPLSSGSALFLFLLLNYLSEPDRRRGAALLMHIIYSLFALANIFLLFSISLEQLYILPAISVPWHHFFFSVLPRLFIMLRVSLIVSALLFLSLNWQEINRNSKFATTLVIIQLPSWALSLDQILSFRIVNNPILTIYARTYAYLLFNAIFYAHAYRKRSHPRSRGNSRLRQYEKRLSEREREVFALLLSHRSYREIGESLFISLDTVKSHASRIYKKVDVSGRNDLLRKLEEID